MNSDKNPFTKEENEIMNLLTEAHNKFMKLKQVHPNNPIDWVNGIHKCQDVLINRVVCRDYPNYFKCK